MFYQGSLFGTLTPEYDGSFAEAQRLDLDHTTWVELVPGWLRGADEVFDELVSTLPFRQRTGVKMYDQLVDDPRLSAWWRARHGDPEPMPLLRDIRLLLAERYAEVSGRDISQLDFYVAFAFWKLACIIEGVYSRYLGGALGDRPPEELAPFKLQVEQAAASAETYLSALP